nr:MAG: hypothetical protein DiTV3a_F14ORF2 [Diabrotica toursvirus 3a]
MTIEPYTCTIILKNKCNNFKFTKDELISMLNIININNKFKNCVSIKHGKKSVSVYTNLTIKINGNFIEGDGTLNDKLKSLLKDINFLQEYEYEYEIVLMNWSMSISDTKIDLVKIMNSINSENNTQFYAYFLRGIPLIVKYTSLIHKKYKRNLKTDKQTDLQEYQKVSMSLFKSGKCIISAPSYEIVKELLNKIKCHIILIN